MRVFAMFFAVMVSACAQTPEQIEARHDLRNQAVDTYQARVSSCRESGGVMEYRANSASRIRGKSLVELRTARCVRDLNEAF